MPTMSRAKSLLAVIVLLVGIAILVYVVLALAIMFSRGFTYKSYSLLVSAPSWELLARYLVFAILGMLFSSLSINYFRRRRVLE